MYSDEIWGRSGPHSIITLTEPVKGQRIQMVDEIKRALDLIHHLDPLPLHRLGERDDGMRPRAAPDLVAVHRRVQGVQLQLGIQIGRASCRGRGLESWP